MGSTGKKGARKNGTQAHENQVPKKWHPKMANEYDRAIGARVRMLRLTNNMTQVQLGKQLGITFQQVQRYEKGLSRLPGSRLQEIADFYKIDAGSLFSGRDGNDYSPLLINRQTHDLIVALSKFEPHQRIALLKLVNAMNGKE